VGEIVADHCDQPGAKVPEKYGEKRQEDGPEDEEELRKKKGGMNIFFFNY